jgi:hypothetical protein
MKSRICAILFAVSALTARGGDFMCYNARETKLVFEPPKYESEYSRRRPVTVTISTNGQTPEAIRLRCGWTTIALTSQQLAQLGPCSFTECGLYVGGLHVRPRIRPHFFLHFHRVDRKGRKSPVTVRFTKGLPAEITLR